jgi:dGTPase
MENNFLSERRSSVEFKRVDDFRMPYERDRARIIHSAAFRRLQAKTQILGIGDGDFHRTRLTHSMEVAQICRGIVHFLNENSSISEKDKNFLPPIELIEAIGLSHDIGHPPFGHGGEAVLNYFMMDSGGFEANGQTIRLLSKLESHTENYGLDLTRRLLLGLLKYPVKYSDVRCLKYKDVPDNKDEFNPNFFIPPKCYMDDDSDVIEWIFMPFMEDDIKEFTSFVKSTDDFTHSKSIYKSFDASIMDVADDIAYGTHDLEDGIALNLITKDDWVSEVEDKLDDNFAKYFNLENIKEELFDNSINKGHKRKNMMGAIVHSLISSTEIISQNKFKSNIFDLQLILKPEAREFLDALKSITTKHMIDLHTVKTFEYRGQMILLSLIKAFNNNASRLLTPHYSYLYENATNEDERKRVICDYVAGMTDEYAIKIYERLFVPRHGNVFEKL